MLKPLRLRGYCCYVKVVCRLSSTHYSQANFLLLVVNFIFILLFRLCDLKSCLMVLQVITIAQFFRWLVIAALLVCKDTVLFGFFNFIYICCHRDTVSQRPRPCSWRRIDHSGGQLQWRKALAECYTSWCVAVLVRHIQEPGLLGPAQGPWTEHRSCDETMHFRCWVPFWYW